jgi:hypothetical protein
LTKRRTPDRLVIMGYGSVKIFLKEIKNERIFTDGS